MTVKPEKSLNANFVVAIPSYKRPKELAKSVASIIETVPSFLKLNIIAINDSGECAFNKAYQEVAAQFSEWPTVQILSNKNNLGYSGTFIRLIELAEADYIYFSADDDLHDFSKATDLIAFLDQVSPAICSTQYMRGKTVYRGSSETRPARSDEFRNVNAHAPGVIYKTSIMRPLLETLKDSLVAQNAAAITYPQLVLTLECFAAEYEIWYYAHPITYEGRGELVSNITDNTGAHYGELSSRIQQFAAFDALIMNLPDCYQHKPAMLRASRTSALSLCLNCDPNLFSGIISDQVGGISTMVKHKFKRLAYKVLRMRS